MVLCSLYLVRFKHRLPLDSWLQSEAHLNKQKKLQLMYGTKQNISFYFTKQTSLFLLSYLKFCRLKPAVSTILIILSVCVCLINNSNTHHRLLIMSNRIREGAQTPSALNTFNMNHLQSASDRTAGHLTSLTVFSTNTWGTFVVL